MFVKEQGEGLFLRPRSKNPFLTASPLSVPFGLLVCLRYSSLILSGTLDNSQETHVMLTQDH